MTLTLETVATRLVTRGRARWKTLALFALVGGAAGVGASFLVDPVFESGAAFQAETQGNFQLPGSLAGLATQLGGIPLGGPVNAQFFADILPSDAVLRRVIADTFTIGGRPATLAAIYNFDDKPAELRDYLVVNRLRRSIASTVNTRTNMVRFSVEGPSPALARALAESILASLNEVNIELRQARAAAEQDFSADRAEEARRELAEAEAALTRFHQRNRIISGSPALATEERRLSRAVDMNQQIYTQLRLQQEQAAVQAVRNTPAISVVDPPREPVRKSRPRRKLAGLFGMFVGLCLGGIRILLERDD